MMTSKCMGGIGFTFVIGGCFGTVVFGRVKEPFLVGTTIIVTYVILAAISFSVSQTSNILLKAPKLTFFYVCHPRHPHSLH